MLLLFLPLMGLVLPAQVPDLVLVGFQLAYPDAEEVSWMPQRNRDYLVKMHQDGAVRIAVFDPFGTRVATGVEIPLDSLPDHIRAAFNWPGVERSVNRVERLDFANGKPLYRFYFLYDGAEVMYEVDEYGQILYFWGED